MNKRRRLSADHSISSERPDVDPFDEENFVEKKVDLQQQAVEAATWHRITSGRPRPRNSQIKQEAKNVPAISEKEYNKSTSAEPTQQQGSSKPTYEFGDRGSSWRMVKLNNLQLAAQDSGRDLEDLAIERYGSLEKYDEAREEKHELSRRQARGIQKTRPDGSLYRKRLEKISRNDCHERKHDAAIREEIKADAMEANGQVIDIGQLNLMKSRILKAELLHQPDVEQLQEEYQAALHHYNTNISADVIEVIPAMDSRGDALSKHEDDMTIEELVREEKRESRLITQSRRDADRIAKDSRYKDDLDYQEENADRLAARVRTKEVNLRNTSINEFQKVNKILDNCPLCYKNEGQEPPIAPVISLGTRVFLSLPSAPLTKYHCLIVPLQHRVNTLECDDDEQLEIRNFMKSLTRLYDSLGFVANFYENNARPHRHSHCAIECVPIPRSDASAIPLYWQEALNSTDQEWLQHRAIISTENNTFYKKMSAAVPYFHVWFDLNGGMGHVVEDDHRWPRDDLFAREVIGAILGLDVMDWRRKGRWTGDANTKAERDFKNIWKRWDWTRSLVETDV